MCTCFARALLTFPLLSFIPTPSPSLISVSYWIMLTNTGHSCLVLSVVSYWNVSYWTNIMNKIVSFLVLNILSNQFVLSDHVLPLFLLPKILVVMKPFNMVIGWNTVLFSAKFLKNCQNNVYGPFWSPQFDTLWCKKIRLYLYSVFLFPTSSSLFI